MVNIRQALNYVANYIKNAAEFEKERAYQSRRIGVTQQSMALAQQQSLIAASHHSPNMAIVRPDVHQIMSGTCVYRPPDSLLSSSSRLKHGFLPSSSGTYYNTDTDDGLTIAFAMAVSNYDFYTAMPPLSLALF